MGIPQRRGGTPEGLLGNGHVGGHNPPGNRQSEGGHGPTDPNDGSPDPNHGPPSIGINPQPEP
ncbi:MAG: hypothetical protein AAF579_00100 [Cyanobacteria bacterium P01_C01_bin.118]